MPLKKEYSQDQTYHRGDIIFHPAFNESGKIKKIEWTSNKLQKLIVDFDEKGETLLIAGRNPENNQNQDKGE